MADDQEQIVRVTVRIDIGARQRLGLYAARHFESISDAMERLIMAALDEDGKLRETTDKENE